MKLGNKFKIYNGSGVLMSDSDLYFLNEKGKTEAVVYVSRHCKEIKF